MGGLYEALAELHAHDAGLARLWRKTAIEEASHAAQFSLLIDTMPGCIEATTLSAPNLLALGRAIENTVEEFLLRRPPIREALVTAIDLEEAMDRVHAHHAMVFGEPRCRRMFKAMMAADNGHVRELRVALHLLGKG